MADNWLHALLPDSDKNGYVISMIMNGQFNVTAAPWLLRYLDAVRQNTCSTREYASLIQRLTPKALEFQRYVWYRSLSIIRYPWALTAEELSENSSVYPHESYSELFGKKGLLKYKPCSFDDGFQWKTHFAPWVSKLISSTRIRVQG